MKLLKLAKNSFIRWFSKTYTETRTPARVLLLRLTDVPKRDRWLHLAAFPLHTVRSKKDANYHNKMRRQDGALRTGRDWKVGDQYFRLIGE